MLQAQGANSQENNESEKILDTALLAEVSKSTVDNAAASNDGLPPPTSSAAASKTAIPYHFYDDRIAVRSLMGNGIGFDRGYSSLDLFLSGEVHPYWRLFADMRGHLFDDDRWAANGGIGVRRQGATRNLIAGANLYYDFREAHHARFHQIGGGLELLGSLWGMRLNGYLPLERKHCYYRDSQDKKCELSLIGGNLEIDRIVWWSRNLDITAALGGYYLHGEMGKHAGGGQFRVLIHATPYLTFRGQTSYDSLFHWRGSGEIALHVPFGKKGMKGKKHRAITLQKDRSAPERFEIIPTYSKN